MSHRAPLRQIIILGTCQLSIGSVFSEGARREADYERFRRLEARRVMDYIHANIDRELSIFDLAKLVQLSPRQFIRIFSNTFGTTPHRYYH